MSTKKKVGISDLLRDEVQKETEVTSQEVTGNVTEQTIEVKAETVNEASNKAIRPALNNGDRSQARIAELEQSLAQSQQREAELVKTVTSLQKELQFSHTNIELLQKSLAAIESLKNDLDRQLVEVKRDNLRLAEANIQLSAQIEAQNKAINASKEIAAPAATDLSASSQLVSQNSQTTQNRATPRKQPVEQPYPHRDRNPYARPTGSNEQLQRINNKNIGWMD